MNWGSLELSDTQAKADTGLLEMPEHSCSGAVSIVVLGLGNILLKDEGVGVHVAKCLQKENLPDNVEVIDGGTAGLDVLLSQQPGYKLVIIDAVKAGEQPGTIYKTQSNVWHPQAQLGDDLIAAIAKTFDFDAATPAGRSRVSLHQIGLLDALRAAERLERMPDKVAIIGVEPADVSLGLELTEPVMQSVPRVVKEVLKEIQDAVHKE
jgi:hydrogenase maturation protease